MGLKSKPQECINSICKNILYVSEVELGLPLQCKSCIENEDQTSKD
jgi:hypothetical protein